MTRIMLILGLIPLLGAACLWPRVDTARSPDFNQYNSDRINEPSGLTASAVNPGVFWVHNDSGDSARLFATTSDGALLAEFQVRGAEAIDWESVTKDTEGNLYVGDIGNNANRRRDLTVYVLREPNVKRGGPVQSGVIEVERKLKFHYDEQSKFPDPRVMNFDAEATFWVAGHLYLLTKHRSDQRTALYRFDAENNGGSTALTKLGEFDLGGDPRNFGGMATGADITSDGRWLSVLTYHAIFIFERPLSGDNYLARPTVRIDLQQSETQQVEGIAWDGQSLLFTNEQGRIYRIDAPLTKNLRLYPTPAQKR